jgi:saccharopine dehydrogenase-like NADP-dependent oxidoreductase
MKLVILGAGLQGNITATDLCDPELSPGQKEITIADLDFSKAKAAGDIRSGGCGKRQRPLWR